MCVHDALVSRVNHKIGGTIFCWSTNVNRLAMRAINPKFRRQSIRQNKKQNRHLVKQEI